MTRAAQDERGSMTMFVLFCSCLVVLGAGIAIDFMRYESQRNAMSSMLDNATLAAASLKRDKSPQEVLDDFMTKGNVPDGITYEITDQEIDLGMRRVETTASRNFDTMFLRMFGLDGFTVSATSRAQERIPNLEVSLVLDISGSMASSSRLANLKPAAKEFVSDLLNANTADNPNRVSISIVPYSMHVNAGENLYKAVTGNNYDHDYSYCADFSSNAFNYTGVPSSSDMSQHAHMTYSYNNNGNILNNTYCRTDSAAKISVSSNDEAALHAQIDALTAGGNTSIDTAVRWGAMLLDPEMQGAFSTLAALPDGAEQKIDSGFAGRPYAWDFEQSQKVMIVMTDGAHTTQYYMKEQFKTGDSGVWFRDSDRRFAYSNPYNSSYRKLDNAEYWARRPLYNHLRSKGERYWSSYWGYNNWQTKDNRLSSVCEAARNGDGNGNGIMIFGISYEAPAHGADVIKDCSSANFYYASDSDNIQSVFNHIVTTVQKLKLY